MVVVGDGLLIDWLAGWVGRGFTYLRIIPSGPSPG